MDIRFALPEEINQIIALFERNLSRNNDALYSEEFFCPLGVKSAIRREHLVIAINNNNIIAAARFYKRKKQKLISLYQFAIDASYRGKGLLLEMLKFICDTDILVLCPKTSSFNTYYRKTGWLLKDSDDKSNYWILPKEYFQTRKSI
ncbi:MAG: GNAT family N-acetyltransferase [Deferribacteres bacterium]|nr:GNAT family N-acetyltransferase [candidate division KSB1 bacterium]MCB9501364.1 GNAT family N-acetyltransferase [Deferribacteres bacterium]